MLRDLTIQNYRAFKDFTIDGLARVNLIVGKNNSGKTSFLEAVYLLANGGSPAALVEILDNRGEFVIDVSPDTLRGSVNYQLTSVFYGYEPNLHKAEMVSISSQQDVALRTTLQVRRRSEALVEGIDAPQLEVVSTHQSAIPDALGRTASEHRLPLHPGYVFTSERRYTRPSESAARSHFLTVALADFDHLANLWDRLIRAPEREAIVLRALKIIEPEIEDIRFTTKRTAGGTFVKLSSRPSRITVSSLGEGVSRLLAMFMSAVMMQDGIMVIDEIDTALYHGVQTEVWRLLIEVAECCNVQIFATTHDWDAVRAFQEALETQPDRSVGVLFRLDDRQGKAHAIFYDAEDLAVVVRQGIEVR
jgi:hypothetical protein